MGIGSGHCSAIINEEGNAIYASFEKICYYPNEDITKNKIFVNEFLQISFDGKKYTKQFYIKNTAILVTKIICRFSETKVYQYYPRKMGCSPENMFVQEIIIVRGNPKIKIFIKENHFTTKRRLTLTSKSFTLSVTQPHLIDKIIQKKQIVLKDNLTITFGLNGHKPYSNKMRSDTLQFWLNHNSRLKSIKNFSEEITDELIRASIQSSHCQCLNTGYIFTAAGRMDINPDGTTTCYPTGRISMAHANKYIGICEKLGDQDPIIK